MKYYIFLIPLLLTTLTKAQQVIPLEVSPRGHILINATVNGVKGKFIFDTGAGFHVVSAKFFKQIKSGVTDSSRFTGFRHTGERLDGPMYQFSEVRLGPLRQQDPWIGVYPGFDEQGFDGLISCKLIERHIVTFDIKHKQLIVETKADVSKWKGSEITILLHADRNRSLDFFIPLKINGRYTALAEFDTGSGDSPVYLHTRYMAYAQLDTAEMEISQSSTGFGNREKTYLDKTKKLKTAIAGSEARGYPYIVFKPSLIYDGLCSHTILGDKMWTIDISNRKMYIWD